MPIDLPFIWAGIIAFAVLAYVVLDGFDLGIGILFPLHPKARDRDVMMNSIAPIWDGNETWLVLGGGGLFAVFPLAYAVVMPALYVPITLMLLALVFRGVAFEFRGRTKRWKSLWEAAFFGGSFTAAFMQGIALGALVQGISMTDRAYDGSWWNWLTPFSVLTGFAVVTGYALLGATWLVLKTTGPLQDRTRRQARPLAFATLAFIAVVSLATPFLDPVYFTRWFAWPGIVLTLPVPLLTALAAWRLITGLNEGRDLAPFLSAQALFILCFIGIGVSFYPHIVPPSLTISEAAAPHSSLLFTLIGTLALMPLILAYTAYSYWVFRGKVDPDAGYH
ncbi:MAG: cytochrome d ubiquinol oxidase subunit II [Albidovulum sp.]